MNKTHRQTRQLHRIRQPRRLGPQFSKTSFFPVDPVEGQTLLLPRAGALLPVVVVDCIGGTWKRGLSALDVLCRTADNRYFLAREVSRDRLRRGTTTPGLPLPKGRWYWLRVKPLSLRAAMLHVTRDCGNPLRADLYDVLGRRHLAPKAAALLDRYTAETGADPAVVISAAVAYVLETAYDPVNGGGPNDDHRRGEFWLWMAEQIKLVKEVAQ